MAEKPVVLIKSSGSPSNLTWLMAACSSRWLQPGGPPSSCWRPTGVPLSLLVAVLRHTWQLSPQLSVSPRPLSVTVLDRVTYSQAASSPCSSQAPGFPGGGHTRRPPRGRREAAVAGSTLEFCSHTPVLPTLLYCVSLRFFFVRFLHEFGEKLLLAYEQSPPNHRQERPCSLAIFHADTLQTLL